MGSWGGARKGAGGVRRLAQKGHKTFRDLSEMALEKGFKLTNSDLSQMRKQNRLRRVKTRKAGGVIWYEVSNAEAKRIIGILEKRKKLLNSYSTKFQINSELKAVSARIFHETVGYLIGRKKIKINKSTLQQDIFEGNVQITREALKEWIGKKWVVVPRDLLAKLTTMKDLQLSDSNLSQWIKSRVIKGIIRDPLFGKLRHLFPNHQVQIILQRTIELNTPNRLYRYTPQQIAKFIRMRGGKMTVGTITKILREGRIPGATQFRGIGPELNWIVDEEGTQRIIEFARVKDRSSRFFLRAAQDQNLTTSEAVAKVQNIAKERQSGNLFTVEQVETKLGLRRGELYRMPIVNYYESGGQKFITVQEYKKIGRTIRARRKARTLMSQGKLFSESGAAKKLGVSRSTIQRRNPKKVIYGGLKFITLEEVKKLEEKKAA